MPWIQTLLVEATSFPDRRRDFGLQERPVLSSGRPFFVIMCLRPGMALPYSDQAIPDAKEARKQEVPAVLKADVSWLVEVMSDGLDLHELGRVGMTCRALSRETQSLPFLGRLTTSWALRSPWVSFA
ncbi:unnamed protein product, partial [Symbiodinium sp. CCMP2456]